MNGVDFLETTLELNPKSIGASTVIMKAVSILLSQTQMSVCKHH